MPCSREDSGGMIRDGKTGDFGVVEVCDQAQHAAQRLADCVESRLVPIGTALAIAGNRTVDQFRVYLRKLFVVQPQTLPRWRAEVFDQDICGLQ